MRPAPRPVVAWLTPAGPTKSTSARAFMARRHAYYRIAKAMVIAKYGGAHEPLLADDDAHPLFARKAALFYAPQELLHGWGEPGGTYVETQLAFCRKRWRAFVTRLARFLAFVDSRRMIADLDGATKHELYEHMQAAERHAQEWMERASAIRKAMDDDRNT